LSPSQSAAHEPLQLTAAARGQKKMSYSRKLTTLLMAPAAHCWHLILARMKQEMKTSAENLQGLQ